MKKIRNKKGLKAALVAIFLVWALSGLYRLYVRHQIEEARKPKPASEQVAVAEKQQRQQNGTMVINDQGWQGVSCLDPSMRIDAKILTDDVYWLVRLDGDDRRVYKLYPRNWNERTHMEIPNNYNLMEWMVAPGQVIRSAYVAYSIHPALEGPSFVMR